VAKKDKFSTEEVDFSPGGAESLAFFPEAGRGKTWLHIVNLARFNPGMIILMGEEGSGRSFLLQRLAKRVNQKPGLMAIIDQIVKTKTDLYRAIAESFSLEHVEGESLDALEERALEFLQGSFVTRRPVILAVDNIQQFSLSMLEELIKLLRRYKKISLLLVGDNNLAAMLKHLDTEKAVRHEITMKPLNRGEMRQFINWRLSFAIDDREFDDIVNTTKGNLGLLEREVQKKESANRNQQSNKSHGFFRRLSFSKRSGLIFSGLVVVIGVVVFYFTKTNEQPGSPQSQQSQATITEITTRVTEPTPAPVASKPAESTADDANKNVLVDRQMELLTTTPDNIKPDVKIIRPEVVQTKVTPEPKPVMVVESVAEPVQKSRSPAVPTAVVPVVAEQKLSAVAVRADDDSVKLLSMAANHYSIQLLGAQSKKTIDRFIETHQTNNALYYFRSERDGKDWYVVMCGEYENRQAAIQAVTELPDDLKKTSPWPRRLSEIQLLINNRSAR